MRLKDRYTLVLAALVTGIAVALGGALLYQTRTIANDLQSSGDRVMRDALYGQLKRHGHAVVTHLAFSLTNPLYQLDMAAIYDLVRNARKQNGIKYVYVVDLDGKVLHDGTSRLVHYGRKISDPATLAALNGGQVGIHLGPRTLMAAAPIVSGSERFGVVSLGIDLSAIQNDILILRDSLNEIGDEHSHTLVITVLTLTGGLLILAWMLSVVVARNLTWPIDQLSRLTKRIAQRDYDFPLPFERGDEVGDLAKALRSMAQDIKGKTVSRDYMESVLDHMLDPLFVFLADGSLETANPIARALLGLPEGKSDVKLDELVRLGERSEERFDVSYIARRGKLESVEGMLIKRDGNRIPALISTTAMRGAIHESDRLLVVARDITERNQIEQQLRQAQKMEAVG